jgi:hypothetical protein
MKSIKIKKNDSLASIRVVMQSLLLFALISSFIGLVASAMAKEPRYGGVYRISSGKPRSLDPHTESYAQTTQIPNNT